MAPSTNPLESQGCMKGICKYFFSHLLHSWLQKSIAYDARTDRRPFWAFGSSLVPGRWTRILIEGSQWNLTVADEFLLCYKPINRRWSDEFAAEDFIPYLVYKAPQVIVQFIRHHTNTARQTILLYSEQFFRSFNIFSRRENVSMSITTRSPSPFLVR